MRMLRFRVALVALGLLALTAPFTSAESSGCDGATCRWRVAAGESLLSGSAWHAEVGEVAPTAYHADGLTLSIESASRAGTFALVSNSVPAPERGSFAVELRSTGDLGRFAFLLREEGYPGWREDPGAADTVLFHGATADWALATWEWERKHPESTRVRVLLRGEARPGASVQIEFRDPYFGPDTTRWTLEDEVEPFAHGPRAERAFREPGDYTVRAERGEGTKTFDVHVPPEPPRVDVRIVPSPVVFGGVRVDASASSTPFHPNLARNGNFAQDRSLWELAPHELGLEGEASGDEGRLRLSVLSPSSTSSAWVRQTVRVVPGVPHEFSWRGWDDGGVLFFGVKLWEPSGTEHLVAAPASGSRGTGAALTFVPGSDSVEVQLRAVFTKGVPGTAWFDDVVLRRALGYEWSLEGEDAPTLGGPLVDLPVSPSRAGDIRLRVTDAFGSAATAALAPGETRDPEVILRDEPLVLLAGGNIVLDATPTSAAAFDALRSARPWALWSLEDLEAPGAARATVGDGEVASVDVIRPEETVGAGVHRQVMLPDGAGASLLAFRYRTSGDVDQVQAVARYHFADGDVASEVRGKFPPSHEWRTATVHVPAAPDGYDYMLVNLRGVFHAGGSGRVEFAHANLGPALVYDWTLGSETLVGPVVSVNAQSIGFVPWDVEVSAPGSPTILTRRGEVAVVSAPALYPTLRDGVAARWNASQYPAHVRVEVVGPASSEADARDGAVTTAAFAAGAYSVVAVSPSGHRATLASATFADRSGLSRVDGALFVAARGTETNISLALPNPDLASVELRLHGPLGRDVTLPLVRDAEAGVWRATWAPSPRDPPGPYRASLTLAESSHGQVSVALPVVELKVTSGEPDGAALLLLGLALGAGAVWARRPTRRWLRMRAAIGPRDAVADVAVVVVATWLGASMRLGHLAPGHVTVGVACVGLLLGVLAVTLGAWAGVPTARLDRSGAERLALVLVGASVVAAAVVAVWHDVAFLTGFPRAALVLQIPLSFAGIAARRRSDVRVARAGGSR